ncbi:ATP-binding protein [Amaricoccus sp.]|uniref:sensor histidine kinase n=1 Tax=Amaricoccus sp. TaxID=1872485 RepID=UPI0025BB220F|nr:ATP-binding protein [Amaricoccus sp.]
MDARQGGDAGARLFSRRLAVALLLGVLAAISAAFGATYWMAQKQDALAAKANVRMVSRGLDRFVETAKASLLDYSLWTAAFERLGADDRSWAYDNIGFSAIAGTFDAAVILPLGAADYGWSRGGPETPRPEVLDPAAVSTAQRLLADEPIDSGEAKVTFARSGGALWLLAIARVAPQEGIPPGMTDADLPRQIFGYELTPERLRDIGEDFLITDLVLADAPQPGFESVPIPDAAGAPLAYLIWTPPQPGRAVFQAALWPLAGLTLIVAAVALVLSRALVGSAHRLELALAGAQRADQSKTQFLANVSHELRTPMNGVIGIAQLLEVQDLDAEAREMVGVLLASARTQLQLINGLLDITRIETGSMRLDRARFDPGAAVDDTMRLLAAEAATKNLALAATVAPAARALFLGDDLAFRQVLTNLVGNAIKFTDTGRIDVDLAAVAGEDGLRVTVSDSGRGIAPDDHARIFERFVQVDGSLTRSAGGAGLGLAIARSLVELMGGTIRVESALGAGSTFSLFLPLARAASPRAMAA